MQLKIYFCEIIIIIIIIIIITTIIVIHPSILKISC